MPPTLDRVVDDLPLRKRNFLMRALIVQDCDILADPYDAQRHVLDERCNWHPFVKFRNGAHRLPRQR